MKVTKKLKGWLVANCEVKPDSTEDEFKMATGMAMVDGKLATEKYVELTKEEDEDEVNEFSEKLDKMTNSIEKLTTVLTSKEEVKEEKEVETETKEVEDEVTEEKKVAPEKEKQMSGTISKMIASQGGTPDDVNADPKVRVKKAIESYGSTKTAMLYPERTKAGTFHPLAGKQVMSHGRPLDTPSELKYALGGTWMKFQLASATPQIAGNPQRAYEMLSEHEKGLFHHLIENEEWDATVKDGHPRSTKGYRGGVKVLLDDAISGGFEAAPIVFDDLAIETPQLYGELWPLINEVPLARGRRVEGVSIGTVTVGWGGVDATPIALFNTAGYVAAFDTTIYRCQGAVQIGLDFMEDTPLNFGQTISRQYGESLLVSLDDCVATGNGATQPQGIMNAAGTTVVAFGGATSLGAYETLLSSIHKREHKPNVMNSLVFCGTYVSYWRARGLNVTAADQRRLGGGESDQGGYMSYKWMGQPYKINESLANTQIFCAILTRYRGYRRKGFTLRTSTEGDTLIRANEMLITFTARYGGQLERGACAATTVTAPA